MLEWRLQTSFDAHGQLRTKSVIREIQRREFSFLATLPCHVIHRPLFVSAFLLATVRAASQDFFWLQRIVSCQLSVIRETKSRELSLLTTFSSQFLSMGGARIGSCQLLCDTSLTQSRLSVDFATSLSDCTFWKRMTFRFHIQLRRLLHLVISIFPSTFCSWAVPE